jgi:hypothetical protein
MNKREFVFGACALACATDAATACEAQASAGLKRRLPDLAAAVDSSAWAAYLDQPFDLGQAGTRQQLRLREVRRVNAGQRGAQFTLAFDGPASRALDARTRSLRHAASGQRLALYLEPVGAGQSASSVRYLAHFNLLA